MEKTQQDLSGQSEKMTYVADETSKDAGIGELLEYHASPEEERRLLLKLDLL